MKRRVRVTGWGQVTQRKEQTEGLLDPLGLMAEAARRAADVSGSRDALRRLDAVVVVKPMSRSYPDAAAQLARALGASPRCTRVSGIGGNSPQALVSQAAGMIARGELDRVLVAGAEAYYPRRGRPAGESQLFQGLPEDAGDDDRVGATPLEERHGIRLPVHGFPLFETALWAESGQDRDSYLRQLGDLWASFSRVAASHPNAWTRTPRTAEEIVTPTGTNRPIAFPYTKFLTSLVSVDLGAAVLLAAEEGGARPDSGGRRPVYFLAGSRTVDRQRFLVEKSSFTGSTALAAAAERALRRAGMEVGEVECFDLYSCFPSSVTIARKMLRLSGGDPRPLTLTGGLGFFGGPGNNYSLHAIATLCEAIAAGARENGMVTALGWFLHKHAAGLYGATPGDTDPGVQDTEDALAPPTGAQPVPVAPEPTGTGTIETYTIVHGRDGSPGYGVLYGRTDKGLRFVARPPADPTVFQELTERHQVGRSVHLRHDRRTGRNAAELA
ncbi:MAG: hypothetical protein ACNA8S_10670 [Deferrisomatales bacterium]